MPEDNPLPPAGTAVREKCFRLAAPSWVIPGTIWENCFFLNGRVDEAELLFLETRPSLAYGRRDLPPELAELDLEYHAHLPLDLPWRSGGEAVAAVCLDLMDKIAFLGAARCVLHPPPGSNAAASLDSFARRWRLEGRNTEDVLLENTRENGLLDLQCCVAGNGFGLCLDLGHMLLRERNGEPVLLPEKARPRMVHLNAPGSGAGKNAHLPLAALDGEGGALGKRLCASLQKNGVIVAEFFDWLHVARSLPVIERWTKNL